MYSDLIITNANIHTMDPLAPHAQALAVRSGRFFAVGDARTVLSLAGPQTTVMDLGGRTVLPGLCDAHIHFTVYALGLHWIDLFEVPSLDELKRRLAERARTTPPGRWLTGAGWNHNLWPGARLPTRHDLDAAAPDHPVLLWEKSGHAAVANSAALALAGLTSARRSPTGGELVRDAAGELTGVLLEDPAIRLVADSLEEPSEDEIDAAVLEAQTRAHSLGLTAIHDLDGRRGFTTFQRLRERDQLRLRTVSHIAMEQLEHALAVGLRAGLGDDWLRVGGLKLFADGALGPRTAAMLAPYTNEPENFGITIVDKEEMLDLVSRASAAGLPTLVHAIGDRANRDVLDVFAEVRRQEATRGLPRASRRHRIEHVQVLHPDDVTRLAELDLIASMQPIHATQDMHNVDAYWGRRGEFSYAFRTLLNAGTRLAFGSDAPVETPNPFVGIHAAVTRRRADGSPGEEGWYPQQRLSVEESVAAYTIGAAYAESWEEKLGSISPGKLADFVVPNHDPFTCSPAALHEIDVELTVVGGEIVYSRS